jgi:two-component system, LytTR family, sensor histidine kinase AlgZ
VWNNAVEGTEELSLDRGLGLENITKRLELLFPDGKTSVQLINSDNGTSVLAIFPFILKYEI